MSNDITITVFNKTGEDQTVVIFQQDPNINCIFDKVFPTAWRVFDLGMDGRSNVILPIQYQIAAGDTKDAFLGSVSVIKNTDAGQKWNYQNNGKYNELEASGTQSDQSISCENKSGYYCSISLAKNDKPLLTYPKVGDGSMSTFFPMTHIYVAWYNNIVEGSQIKGAISQPQALGIDLEGAKEVDAELTKSGSGRLSWSVKVNGTPVSLLADSNGYRPHFSVTNSVLSASIASEFKWS